MLGWLWSLFTPLLYLLVFVLVFSEVFAEIENYPIFALSGIMVWNFFSSTVNQLLYSILENGAILKSVNVPPILFPSASLIAALVNFLISIIPFAIILFLLGYSPSWEVLFVVPVLLLLVVFVYGFGLLLCTLQIFYRDVGMLWTTLTPALFYFTPIAYSTARIPADYLFLLKLNPLYHFVELFRTVVYAGEIPTLKAFAICTAIAVATLLLGTLVYRQLHHKFISHY